MLKFNHARFYNIYFSISFQSANSMIPVVQHLICVSIRNMHETDNPNIFFYTLSAEHLKTRNIIRNYRFLKFISRLERAYNLANFYVSYFLKLFSPLSLNTYLYEFY